MQQYLGSMEGAVLSGKLTARAIAQDYPASTVINNKEATLVA
jgi:15-cis-phytoene desaturase